MGDVIAFTLTVLFIYVPYLFLAFCAIISGICMFERRVKTEPPGKPKMKIEAIIVCVDYADFLAWTLPINRNLFDRMVVVTSPTDKRTQKLCEYWHVQCVVTEAMYKDGAKFNKGAAINKGLEVLAGDGWIVHMDADIFLPPLFRNIVDNLEFDELGVYSCDRMMCDSFETWLKFYTQPIIQNEDNVYVHPRPFRLGVRIAKKEWGGWTPVGYFQMWNQNIKKIKYSEKYNSAGESDLLFITENFTRNHRHMLAEIIAIHLESKIAANMGSNWNGRKTPEFGPNVNDGNTIDTNSSGYKE